jgi:glycine dehydrogenase subunit 1
MARRLVKRDGVVVSGCVHPHYRETTRAYLEGSSPDALKVVPVGASGAADVETLIATLTEDTACVVVGSPSYLGPVTDLRALAEACHDKGALLVVSVVEPYALALVEAPGAWGADIVTGEGQPLACPPQYGGPGVGLLACRQERKYLQQLPGRVCGETVDQDGKQGFVLTLSTREQHIRRERATSNICTNQGLLALAFTIRLALLGKSGFVEVAKQCLAKAHFLRQALSAIDGIELVHPDAQIFNEFAIRVRNKSAQDFLTALEKKNIVGGLDLSRFEPNAENQILLAVTEQHTREDLDEFITAAKGAAA